MIALSGDLPMGNLSMPGSGFLPKIVAVLTIFFGLVLIAAREREQGVRHADVERRQACRAWSWRSPRPPSRVFEWLGFLTTNVLLIFALLVVIERRRLLPATVYSLGVVVTTYVLFVYVLKTPLNTGPFGF